MLPVFAGMRVWRKGNLLSIMLYNPMHLLGQRLPMVSHAMRKAHVDCLPSTGRFRSKPDLAVEYVHDSEFLVLSASRPRGSNKSTGVALFLNKSSFAKKQIVDCWAPPTGPLAGRYLQARLCAGLFDYTFCVPYFAPRSTPGAYDINEAFVALISSRLS